jgi:hypothetical protein
MQFLSVVFASVLLQACGSDSSSFSILPDSQDFQQSTSFTSTKIDILWVIDNSGSMDSSQQNLVENFDSFIKNFSQKSYDFHMAVTTTDAFMADPLWTGYYNDPWNNYYYKNRYYYGLAQDTKAQFRDGVPGVSSSGYRVMDNNTPNLIQTFNVNARQGILGYGDERAFQSITSALGSPYNTGFRRDDAFLAVIIVSDEDDFSYDNTTPTENVNLPSLHPVSRYVDYLDQYTGSSGATRRYSVSTISINDQQCLDLLNATTSGRKIGQRIGALATATGGTVGNICGNFGEELTLIQDKILNALTQFYLDRKPKEDTIRVFVDNVKVPRAADNNGAGWTYSADANSIVFTEEFRPPQGAQISVAFDPAGLDF